MKVYGDFDLDFSKLQDVLIDEYQAFPNPAKPGMIVRLKTDNILYFCSAIDAATLVPVWVPLSNQYNYATHTQSTASNVWTIYHSWYAVGDSKAFRIYNTSGENIIPTYVDMSNSDYTIVYLPVSMIGTAVILKQGDGVDSNLAKYVSLTASGNISSTNVQSALYELDTEKLNVSDVVTSPSANKLLKLNASSQLPASITGNAATSTKLETARTITLAGSISGSRFF